METELRNIMTDQENSVETEKDDLSRREAEAAKGVIFNIQRYSIHDGPGIRTTVFMTGCPLRCLWCQNPESQEPRPTIFLYGEKCTACGRCVDACPEAAIEIYEGRSRTDRRRCKSCGTCAEVCPNEARNLMGRIMTAGEVFREVAEDAIFYEGSGGGVTLSGGEPLAQPRFAMSILKLCREADIHTAIETCGFAKWETTRRILKYVDLVLFDFKHMDPREHEKCTGVSNEAILENARRIVHELSIPMRARLPIIPGYNDSLKNVAAAARFIAAELDISIPVHLLPYHRLGVSKYKQMEMPERSMAVAPPTDEHMSKLKTLVESFGLSVEIGG